MSEPITTHEWTPERSNGRIVIVIVTVGETREASSERVAEQWRGAGYRPMVLSQPADWPRGPAAHSRAMKRALAVGAEGCDGVVFCEDDIELSRSIARWIPRLQTGRRVTTLYLPGLRFYSAGEADRITSGRQSSDGILPVMNWRHWFGSQCVYFPAAAAREFAASDMRLGVRDGGDIHLREWLRTRGERLYYASPNPVQHLALPSVTSALNKPHRSRSYVG